MRRNGAPMTHRSRNVGYLIAGAVVGLLSSLSQGQPFLDDRLVQPPQLNPSGRASMIGQYARTAFGPPDVSRGAFSLPSPLSVPTDRGELLFNPFPVYSGDSGASE